MKIAATPQFAYTGKTSFSPATPRSAEAALPTDMAEISSGAKEMGTDYVGIGMLKGALIGVTSASLTGAALGFAGCFTSHPVLSTLGVVGTGLAGTVGGTFWAWSH